MPRSTVKSSSKPPEKTPAPISKLHIAMAEIQAGETTAVTSKKKKRFNFAGYQAADSSNEVSSESIAVDPTSAQGLSELPIPSISNFDAPIDRSISPSASTVKALFLSSGSETKASAPDAAKKAEKAELLHKRTEAEKRLCLPLCAFVKPLSSSQQPYFKPTNISRENLWGNLPKHDHTKVFLDLQLAYCLGLENGRQLLEKYPKLQSRVANNLEKTALESTPVSQRLLSTMALTSDISWVSKTEIDGYQCLKLPEVDIHLIFWNEELFHILSTRIGLQEKSLNCSLDWIQDLIWPLNEEDKKEAVQSSFPERAYVHKFKRFK
jgi:hypothetical protein